MNNEGDDFDTPDIFLSYKPDGYVKSSDSSLSSSDDLSFKPQIVDKDFKVVDYYLNVGVSDDDSESYELLDKLKQFRDSFRIFICCLPKK